MKKLIKYNLITIIIKIENSVTSGKNGKWYSRRIFIYSYFSIGFHLFFFSLYAGHILCIHILSVQYAVWAFRSITIITSLNRWSNFMFSIETASVWGQLFNSTKLVIKTIHDVHVALMVSFAAHVRGDSCNNDGTAITMWRRLYGEYGVYTIVLLLLANVR